MSVGGAEGMGIWPTPVLHRRSTKGVVSRAESTVTPIHRFCVTARGSGVVSSHVSSADDGGQYVTAILADPASGPLPQQQYSDGGGLGGDWQWSDMSGGDDQIQCARGSWMVRCGP